MAYFCGANNDTVLKPLVATGSSVETMIGWDGRPVGSVTAGEYYTRMFDDLYGNLTSGTAVAAS